MHLDAWAQRQAHQHLRSLEKRWVHIQAVARQAERLGRFLEPAEHQVLVAAAYLHDVGYAPSLANSGFHPLDGARWLTGLGHDRLAGLVANHSGSKHEAALRGLCGELPRSSRSGAWWRPLSPTATSRSDPTGSG
jgi:HD superfamily phosphodiesterase